MKHKPDSYLLIASRIASTFQRACEKHLANLKATKANFFRPFTGLIPSVHDRVES